MIALKLETAMQENEMESTHMTVHRYSIEFTRSGNPRSVGLGNDSDVISHGASTRNRSPDTVDGGIIRGAVSPLEDALLRQVIAGRLRL